MKNCEQQWRKKSCLLSISLVDTFISWYMPLGMYCLPFLYTRKVSAHERVLDFWKLESYISLSKLAIAWEKQQIRGRYILNPLIKHITNCNWSHSTIIDIIKFALVLCRARELIIYGEIIDFFFHEKWFFSLKFTDYLEKLLATRRYLSFCAGKCCIVY